MTSSSPSKPRFYSNLPRPTKLKANIRMKSTRSRMGKKVPTAKSDTGETHDTPAVDRHQTQALDHVEEAADIAKHSPIQNLQADDSSAETEPLPVPTLQDNISNPGHPLDESKVSHTKPRTTKNSKRRSRSQAGTKPLYQPWKAASPKSHYTPPSATPTPRADQDSTNSTQSQSQQQKELLTKWITFLQTPLAPLVSITTGLPHPQFPSTVLAFYLLTHDQLDNLVQWYHQTPDTPIERLMYPRPIAKIWPVGQLQYLVPVDLATKRHRFGTFIGLHVCTRMGAYGEDANTTTPTTTITTANAATQADLLRDAIERPHPHWDRDLSINVRDPGFGPGPAVSSDDTDTDINTDMNPPLLDNIPVEEENADVESEVERIAMMERMDAEWLAALKRAEEERKMQEKIWRGRW